MKAGHEIIPQKAFEIDKWNIYRKAALVHQHYINGRYICAGRANLNLPGRSGKTGIALTCTNHGNTLEENSILPSGLKRDSMGPPWSLRDFTCWRVQTLWYAKQEPTRTTTACKTERCKFCCSCTRNGVQFSGKHFTFFKTPARIKLTNKSSWRICSFKSHRSMVIIPSKFFNKLRR